MRSKRTHHLSVPGLVLLLTGLLGGCGTAPSADGGALDGLQACPDGADDVIGVFLRLGGPTEDEPDRSDAALDTWALTSSGDIRAVTTDGRHGQPLISPDARYVYNTLNSGLELGGSPEPATSLERRDLRTSEVSTLREFTAIIGVSLSADGRRIAVSEPPADLDAQIPEYRVSVLSSDGDGDDITVGIAATNQARTASVALGGIALSPDGRQLAYFTFTYADNDLGTAENAIHVRDLSTGEDTVLARSEGSTSVADVLWSLDGTTVLVGTNYIPEPGTLDTPQVDEVLRIDLATGAQTVDEAFAAQFEPISSDGSVLIGLTEVPDEQGPPSTSLVAWGRSSPVSTVLPLDNPLSLLSVASCSFS